MYEYQLPDEGEALDDPREKKAQEPIERSGGQLLSEAPIAIAGLETIGGNDAPVNSSLAV